MIARPARRSRFRPPLAALALVLAACTKSPTPADGAPAPAPAPVAAPVAAPRPSPPAPAWRSADALRAGLPAGANAVPVIEVTDGVHFTIDTVAAVHRPDRDPQIALELWHFVVRGPEQSVLPGAASEPILRLRRDDPAAEALTPLRVLAATPGNTVLRPRGVESDGAADLLVHLADAVRTSQDPRATVDSRLWALSELVRGLDDHLVLERDAIFRVVGVFAGGAPEIASTEELGARRIRMRTGGDDPLVLEILRGRDGWVLGDLRRADEAAQGASGSAAPAAEPSPTAP